MATRCTRRPASVLEGGVYFSDDNGSTWTNIVAGLPGVQVEEADLRALLTLCQPADIRLYTLTSRTGLWECAERQGRLYLNPSTGPFSADPANGRLQLYAADGAWRWNDRCATWTSARCLQVCTWRGGSHRWKRGARAATSEGIGE
ncbi:MAG: hypothetical protein IPN30_09840 [Flavobacteriales bacterium]|nr:hypothetical protein [Flavobacteriales bacterium]